MSVLNKMRQPCVAGVRSLLNSSKQSNSSNAVQVRNMAGQSKMKVTPSRFQWERAKDDFHYFITLGLVPVGLIITYNNVRVGPAELREIPEGYVPQTHEYLRCPTQRMMSRFYPSYEKMYERNMYFLEKARLRQVAVMKMKKARALSKINEEDKVLWVFVPDYIDQKEAYDKEFNETVPHKM